ncbi:queuosine precursor transporter [Candidatus Lariskella endosymbiont of Hedychridium roseum]|uniref:queuosine precursor transporter n=1 Tax=Candidatus Lariskella endosymbiont of Hedychridium roseum TaxID=3077949 RepID=UPI0030D0EE56
MPIAEKVYASLCILFSGLIILGNLVYQKFVILHVPSIYTFELSAGAILYPLTFSITDLITEFYGKARANFCVRFAILTNIVIATIIALIDYLPATSWSKVDNLTFHKVFGFYSVAFIGSMIACYVSQAVDIMMYLWIYKLTKGKHLWLRNNGSTCISLFIDTTIVIVFLTMFKVLPAEQMLTLIFNSYVWKLFFTICSTPMFYIYVRIIKLILKN